MKNVTVIVIMMVMVATTANAGGWRTWNTDVNERGHDRYIHLGIGAVSGGLVYHYTDHLPTWQRIGLSVLAVTAIATAKELTDRNFYWSDVSEYTIGAGFGIMVYRVSF